AREGAQAVADCTDVCARGYAGDRGSERVRMVVASQDAELRRADEPTLRLAHLQHQLLIPQPAALLARRKLAPDPEHVARARRIRGQRAHVGLLPVENPRALAGRVVEEMRLV